MYSILILNCYSITVFSYITPLLYYAISIYFYGFETIAAVLALAHELVVVANQLIDHLFIAEQYCLTRFGGAL